MHRLSRRSESNDIRIIYKNKKRSRLLLMKIIIPMAGLGTRFQKAADTNPEYRIPKPFIKVRGSPMVKWALGSLPFLHHYSAAKEAHHRAGPEDLIFIILKEHDDRYKIKEGLEQIYSSAIKVIVLPRVTRGAAETAYQAKEYIADNEEIIITDSDHFFDGSHLAKAIDQKGKETAGIIPVFTARNEGIPKWSYSLVRPGTNMIEKVAEKDRTLMEAGAYANIGAYYFSVAKVFFDEAKEIISKNRLTGDEGKKEFYIAPMYQNLIEKGYQFEAAVTPEVWGLGTPSDLDYFLSHCKTEMV